MNHYEQIQMLRQMILESDYDTRTDVIFGIILSILEDLTRSE